MDYLEKTAKRVNLQRAAVFLAARLKAFGFTRQKLPSCIALAVCPAITFYLFDFYTHNPFAEMRFQIQLLNIVFYELTAFLLFGLVKYVRTALMLQSGLFMVIGLVNYFVLNFRSAPIMPWDIFSLGTAASVAGNYEYALEKETVLVLAAFLLLLAAESRFTMAAPRKKRKRAALVALPLLFLWGYVGLIQSDAFVRSFGLYDKLFTPAVMNKRDGNAVAFLMELEYLSVEKPKGYSEEEMSRTLQSFQSEKWLQAAAHPESIKRPNIFVIMDEAFSDLSVLGEINTNQDYMPFIHSLQQGADNTITGLLNVSVLGGNTANTEFEFLTGNTMGFLPQGSVAYQQYVKQNIPSLASSLKELGYTTVAVHPYYADGWDRDRVYPLLGFDRFLSIEDFKQKERLRKYVSDRGDFQKLIELYEEKNPGEPLFVFNVTMQNHSGYDEEFHNFQPSVSAEGISSKSLSNYLSLMKETDRAFRELVEYFSEASEDTMIVFFGDHQPTTYVSNPVLRANGIDPDSFTEEQNLLRYKVPYVIWSNFPMEDTDLETGQETSANYLAIDVLLGCGLPLPAPQAALRELRAAWPIVSAMQAADAKGVCLPVDEWGKKLNPYRSLAYYLLFDYDKAYE